MNKSIEPIEFPKEKLEKLPHEEFQFGYNYVVASDPDTEGEFRCCWCNEKLFQGISYIFETVGDTYYLNCNIPLTTAKAIISFGNAEVKKPDYGGNLLKLHMAIGDRNVEAVKEFLESHPEIRQHDILNYPIIWYVNWLNPERNRLPMVSVYETRRFFCKTDDDERKINAIMELLQKHGAKLDTIIYKKKWEYACSHHDLKLLMEFYDSVKPGETIYRSYDWSLKECLYHFSNGLRKNSENKFKFVEWLKSQGASTKRIVKEQYHSQTTINCLKKHLMPNSSNKIRKQILEIFEDIN